MKLRCVIFAYQEVGYVCFEELLRRGAEVSLVVTHPDDPKEEIWFRSVAGLAKKNGIPVVETEEVSSPGWPEKIAAARPDAIFSFMFRKMIPEAVLKTASRGAFNLHPSFLPKYRGRCPANWVLVNGEEKTGITLHEMVKRADAGRIVAQAAIPIGPEDDVSDLYKKFTAVAPGLVGGVLDSIASGTYKAVPQDDSVATKFGGRKPDDGRFAWDWPAVKIHNLVRAVAHPYPGAFCVSGGRKLFVWKTGSPRSGSAGSSAPGTVLSLSPLAVETSSGPIELMSLQYEGEQEFSARDFVKRYNLTEGSKL